MRVFHSWLDDWDERRAQRGEDRKQTAVFAQDADLAFPGAPKTVGIEEFGALAGKALADPAFFEAAIESSQGFERVDEWLRFPSDISTDVEQNNVVWAKIKDSGKLGHAVVIFHHWNANTWNSRVADYLARRGITTVEIALPYHFQRSRPGSDYADYMLGPNLGRTIQSVRQAVLDGRKLIRWLQAGCYRQISVFGMSLGSWVAGLIAAHDPTVSKASLFLTAGSLADMVWTGRATRSIRDSLEPFIDLHGIRIAWSPLNLENHAYSLARPGLDLHIVLAKRDRVVLPELSKAFTRTLKEAGVRPAILELNCGHYSLAIPPYNILAGWSLRRFLLRSPIEG